MSLHVGDLHRITATFKNAAGVPTNPTDAKVRVRKPDGTLSEYTPTSDGSGVYHYDIPIDQAREWEYAFVGTGAVTTAEPSRFYVSPSRVLQEAVTP